VATSTPLGDAFRESTRVQAAGIVPLSKGRFPANVLPLNNWSFASSWPEPTVDK
jgi:hypothetical protein